MSKKQTLTLDDFAKPSMGNEAKVVFREALSRANKEQQEILEKASR